MQVNARVASDWSEHITMRGGTSVGGELTRPSSASYLRARVRLLFVPCAPAVNPNMWRAFIHHMLGLAMRSRACVRCPLPRIARRGSHAGSVLLPSISG